MKTLKITEETHRQLIELQSYIYNNQGIKFTFNELIAWSAAKLMVDQENEHK